MVGRTGRLAPSMELAARDILRNCCLYKPSQVPGNDADRRQHHDGYARFLRWDGYFRGKPLQGADGREGNHRCKRWERVEPIAAVVDDGDSSAFPLSGLRRFHRAICFRYGISDHETTR